MFKDWDNYYLMIGSASGALIGLLFVVATLTGNREEDQVRRGAQVYMTPTVFHFTVVLVLSALTAVPGLQARSAGIIGGLVGVLGLVYASWVIVSLTNGDKLPEGTHWSDLWFYGVGPSAAYLVLIAGAATVGVSWAGAAELFATALMVLLLTAIRNAWDLVTYLAPEANKS